MCHSEESHDCHVPQWGIIWLSCATVRDHITAMCHTEESQDYHVPQWAVTWLHSTDYVILRNHMAMTSICHSQGLHVHYSLTCLHIPSHRVTSKAGEVTWLSCESQMGLHHADGLHASIQKWLPSEQNAILAKHSPLPVPVRSQCDVTHAYNVHSPYWCCAKHWNQMLLSI